MTEKMIKVKNTLDRYFNGAKKGQIIEVPEKDLNYYLKHGFVKVEPVKAIVEGNEKTKAEIIKELEKYGVEFDKKAKKEELEKLLEKTKQEFEN